MATGTQLYSTQAGRINEVRGEMIAHAVAKEVLGITGSNKKMPKNQGDNVTYRAVVPFGATTTSANTQNRPSVTANNLITQEGVTPQSNTLTYRDVNVRLQQYMVLFGYSDKTADLYEDDVPADMKEQTGEVVGLCREMIRYGVLKGGTNTFYAGGTSRATTDEVISYNFLSNIARNLLANHGDLVTGVLAPSSDVNTAGIEASYLVFCHTDCEHDIRAIPNFKETVAYGQRKLAHELEIGSVGRFRFIVSPELAPYADSGAAVAGLVLKSTTGTSADVYPVIVVAKNAWGDVALRGSALTPIMIPHTQQDKSDPGGQRGYVGAKFYAASVILNQGWMAVGEVAVTDLS